MRCIIYPGESGPCIVVPTGVFSDEETARKDVPAGVPYLFIRRDDIPSNPEAFAAWAPDFSSPDGYGIGPEAWFAEQAAKA